MYLQLPHKLTKSKVKDQTPFSKSLIIAVMSISRRMSYSMLMIAILTSLP